MWHMASNIESRKDSEMGGDGSGRRKILETKIRTAKHKAETQYNGPPAYLLDPNRDDPFADPKNVFQEADGTNRPISWGRHAQVQPKVSSTVEQDCGKDLTSKHHNQNKNNVKLNESQSVDDDQALIKIDLQIDSDKSEHRELPECNINAAEPHCTKSQQSSYNAQDYQRTSNKRKRRDSLSDICKEPDLREWDWEMQDEGYSNARAKYRQYDEFSPPDITYPPTASMHSNVRGNSGTIKDPSTSVNCSSSSRVDTLDILYDRGGTHSPATYGRKRRRTELPEDDIPMPFHNDMRIHPNENTYIRVLSGRRTRQTPQEHWEQRKELLTEQGRNEAECERRMDLEARRAERKKKDELANFQGLSSFQGDQRGWNGQSEQDRKETIRKYHEDQVRKSQVSYSSLRTERSLPRCHRQNFHQIERYYQTSNI